MSFHEHIRDEKHGAGSAHACSGEGCTHPSHAEGASSGSYVRHPKFGVGKVVSKGIHHGKPHHRIKWASGRDSMHSNAQVGKMGGSSKSGWDAWRAKNGK